MTLGSAILARFQGLRMVSRFRGAPGRRPSAPVSLGSARRERPLLDAMILQLGLERAFAFAEPPLLSDIERRCEACATRGICRQWLQAGEATQAYRRFCPNARNFDVMTGHTAA